MLLHTRKILIAATVVASTLGSAGTPAQTPPSAPPAPPHHEGMSKDTPAAAGHDMAAMGMTAQFGRYSMSREASGTSWQPEATPMEMISTKKGDWSLMAHGYANFVYDKQSGPRGDSKMFTESMLMLMANRPVGPGTLGFRSMLSLDPTIGKSGYPLLYQTGETADGSTPLIDRQHPHDLFMELSSSYSLPLGEDRAAFVYLGLPGEPALGPPTFMHRYSGMRNPEAPIAHHWFDSTHITFGVATVGASQGPFKLEGSWFNGREPDQFRWNIETRKLDSWSTRLSFNPTPEWALQASYGYLKSPEALEPDTSVRRLTASASYLTKLAGNDWATTLAWARNDKRGPEGRSRLPAVLLESTYVVADTHTFFGRLEQVDKDELFPAGQPLHGQSFKVRKLALGYIYDFASTGPVRWGLGGDVGILRGPSALDASYGRNPMSYLVFLQARIAKP